MISIDVKGLEDAKELLAYLHDLGNVVQNAEVLGHQRQEQPGLNNAEVLQYLGEQNPKSKRNTKRDFYSMSAEEQAVVVDRPFLEKLWESVEKIAAKPVVVAGRLKSQAAYASQAMGNSLKAACLSYLRWVTDNIESQRWKGGGSSSLSEEYADTKQRKYGFTQPIGKASGQLIDNVAPNAKNIKLNRSK